MIIRKKSIPSFSIDFGTTAALKFTCCIIIVLHHFSQYIVSEIGDANLFTTVLSSQGGYLAVSFFFFLSGYGLSINFYRKTISFVEYLRKRLSKVYMPAVLVSIIWIIILNILHINSIDISQKSINIPSIIKGVFESFILSFYDPVLWFVKIIILFYVLLYAYKKINHSIKSKKTLTLILFTVFSTIFVRYTIDTFASVSVPAFYIGVYTAENPSMSKTSFFKYTFTVILICATSLMFVGDFLMGVHGGISIVVLLFLVYMLSYCEMTMCCPKFCGDMSYDVYLVHNKVKILTLYFAHDLSLFFFILCTAICTVAFWWIRHKVDVIIKYLIDKSKNGN